MKIGNIQLRGEEAKRCSVGMGTILLSPGIRQYYMIAQVEPRVVQLINTKGNRHSDAAKVCVGDVFDLTRAEVEALLAPGRFSPDEWEVIKHPVTITPR